jgi:hypothetical protein
LPYLRDDGEPGVDGDDVEARRQRGLHLRVTVIKYTFMMVAPRCALRYVPCVCAPLGSPRVRTTGSVTAGCLVVIGLPPMQYSGKILILFYFRIEECACVCMRKEQPKSCVRAIPRDSALAYH